MAETYAVRMLSDVKVPMRDGVRLSADVYLPQASGPFPTVLIRTPYDNNADPLIQNGRRLANNGYACVIQDCRGRFDSEGSYYPGLPIGTDLAVRAARQTVWHSRAHPSDIVLPVIPPAG